MGHLQKFHEKYAAEGLQVFVVSMQPDIEEAKKTTREKGWTYPIMNGLDSEVGQKYARG